MSVTNYAASHARPPTFGDEKQFQVPPAPPLLYRQEQQYDNPLDWLCKFADRVGIGKDNFEGSIPSR